MIVSWTRDCEFITVIIIYSTTRKWINEASMTLWVAGKCEDFGSMTSGMCMEVASEVESAIDPN